jgi:transposase
VPCPDAQARRDRGICRATGRRHCGGDRSSRRDVDLSSEYSPDLNPIELAFSKLKAHLRKAAEHTILRLLRRIGRVVTDFSPARMQVFRHASFTCEEEIG